jgi:large subunit ribosomal protein L28
MLALLRRSSFRTPTSTVPSSTFCSPLFSSFFAAPLLPTTTTTTTPCTSFSTNKPKKGLNRAKRGLYGGKRVIFGNNVSHSKRRTKRRWSPNVQTKRYTSDLLDEQFKIKLTTSVMRTIKKYGSLDNYLLETPERKLYDSEFGLRLKRRVTKAQKLHDSESTMSATIE